MKDNQQKIVVGSGSFPVAGLLGVVFVTLKLLGVINWSWWWVTAPFWGPLAIGLLLVGVGLLLVFVATCCEDRAEVKRHEAWRKRIGGGR